MIFTAAIEMHVESEDDAADAATDITQALATNPRVEQFTVALAASVARRGAVTEADFHALRVQRDNSAFYGSGP